MTLRLDMMKRMLAAETAASDWFSKMTPAEQQAYKKAHPHSKMGAAPSANAPIGGPKTNEQQGERMTALIKEHSKRARDHDAQVEKHLSAGNHDKADHHARMSSMHKSAVTEFVRARGAYNEGKTAQAKKNHKAGLTLRENVNYHDK